MKKLLMISAMLLALLLAVSFAACTGGKDPEPTEAPATEAPATDAPEETAEAPTHEFDAALAGDWYGIFRVGDAGGKYRDNAGRSNDCAVRFAIGENGEGPFYCVINGLGDGAFGSCTARADMSGVTVEGNVAGEAVSWRFDLLSGKLLLSSLYGSGDDYMLFDITLRPCGDDWAADAAKPAGLDYTAKYGFNGVVEQMGGSLNNVPALSGEGLNLRLTDDPVQEAAPAFDDEGRTVSANGHFSIVLPEGFSVTEDGDVFAIEGEGGSVRISYELVESDKSAMESLMSCMHNEGYNELYRYYIDGYSCYGTVREIDGEYEFVLIGEKDAGRLLYITLGGRAAESVQWIIEKDADFMQAVYGLLVKDE